MTVVNWFSSHQTRAVDHHPNTEITCLSTSLIVQHSNSKPRTDSISLEKKRPSSLIRGPQCFARILAPPRDQHDETVTLDRSSWHPPHNDIIATMPQSDQSGLIYKDKCKIKERTARSTKQRQGSRQGPSGSVNCSLFEFEAHRRERHTRDILIPRAWKGRQRSAVQTLPSIAIRAL